MPTLITKGAMSVHSLGFGYTPQGAGGGPFWLAAITTDSTSAIFNMNCLFDKNNDIYVNFIINNSLKSNIKLNKTNANIEWQDVYGNDTYTKVGATSSVDNSLNYYSTLSGSSYLGTDYTNLIKYDSSGNLVAQLNNEMIQGYTWYQMQNVIVDPSNNLNVYVNVYDHTPGVYATYGFGLIKLTGPLYFISGQFYQFPLFYTEQTYASSYYPYVKSVTYGGQTYFTFAGDFYPSSYTFWGIFVVKYDNDQNIVWSKLIDHTGTEQFANAFANSCFDSVGNVYVTYYDGTISHLVKLNSSDGSVLWSKSIDPYVYDVVVSMNNNNVYIFGESCIYCFDSNGTLLWCNSLTNATTSPFYLYNLAVNENNEMVIISQANDLTVFVFKFPADGNTGQGTYTLAGNTFNYAPFTPTITNTSSTVTDVTFGPVSTPFSFTPAPIPNTATTYTEVEIPF